MHSSAKNLVDEILVERPVRRSKESDARSNRFVGVTSHLRSETVPNLSPVVTGRRLEVLQMIMEGEVGYTREIGGIKWPASIRSTSVF